MGDWNTKYTYTGLLITWGFYHFLRKKRNQWCLYKLHIEYQMKKLKCLLWQSEMVLSSCVHEYQKYCSLHLNDQSNLTWAFHRIYLKYIFLRKMEMPDWFTDYSSDVNITKVAGQLCKLRCAQVYICMVKILIFHA